MRPGREDSMRNYTDTETFKAEYARLKALGASDEFLQCYKELYSQFDENGMELGTDYSACVLAFPHPIP